MQDWYLNSQHCSGLLNLPRGAELVYSVAVQDRIWVAGIVQILRNSVFQTGSLTIANQGGIDDGGCTGGALAAYVLP